MVGWTWSRASEGADGQPRKEAVPVPVPGGDMASGNSAAQPRVEKDVLAAGRTACYKVCLSCVLCFSGSVSPEYWVCVNSF